MRISSLMLLLACNEPPAAPVISIAPDDPRTGDDLLAVILGDAADPDADEVTYTYAWYQDGVPRSELSTDTVPNAETAKGERWMLVVTPFDGKVEGAIATAETVILNTAPEGSLTLSPEAPLAGEALTGSAEATDADGDVVSWTYAWTVDGADAGVPSYTLSEGLTHKGEVWTLTATPSDEEEAGDAVSASVTIANTPPALASVTLGPDPATVSDTLSAAAAEPTDADGDAVSLRYAWRVNGVEVTAGVDTTLTSAWFQKHDTVDVVVTPNDGADDGAAVTSNAVTIQNSAPGISGATLAPDPAYEASTLTCTAEGWSDADGDAEGLVRAWSVNGAVVDDTETLDGALFGKGDLVACTLTPDDGETLGDPVTSAELVISNTPPVCTGASLSSASPTELDTLSVVISGDADDDGDAITYSTTWVVNGAEVATTETLDGASFDRGDTVYAVVMPWDGEDWGAPVTTATATVVNSAPVLASGALSPDPLYTDDTASVSLSATDADGDAVSYTYRWTVDGVVVATSATLDGDTWFDRGQVISVEVTPTDGDATGAAWTSDAITVSNTPPEGLAVEMSPADAAADDDDLVCVVLAEATDADGDAVTYTYRWTRDGDTFTSTSTTTRSGDTVDADLTASGESYTCTVTPSDGTDDGETASATVDVGCSDCGLVGDYYVTAADLVLKGVGGMDYAGWAVVMADLDGDGLDDPIVSAYLSDPSGKADAGRVYAVAGGTVGTMSLASSDHVLSGAGTNYQAGFGLAAGDLDGDGVADLVIGQPGQPGTALVLGPPPSSASLSAADVVLTGVAGYANAALDMDGDGVAEAVTADYSTGSVYVTPAPGTATSTFSSAASLVLGGETTGDYAGRWAEGGDVDGDGLEDLFVSATYDAAGGSAAGAAYLVLGGASGSLGLADADLKLVGEAANDVAGRVLALGDLGGDGTPDLIVGAPGESTAGSNAGAFYVVNGTTTSGIVDLSSADIKYVPSRALFSLTFVHSLASGDLDGDGQDDLVFGDQGWGGVRAFYGPLSGAPSTSSSDLIFYCEQITDQCEAGDVGLGDANGDGAAEILIGGYMYSETSYSFHGRAWLTYTGP